MVLNSIIKLATPKLHFLSGLVQGTSDFFIQLLTRQFTWMHDKSFNMPETKLLIFLRAITFVLYELEKDLSFSRQMLPV